MTNDSQKVRDILGWAQNMPEAVLAMMALTDLVGALEKRLTALEAAKPQDGSSASCDEMLDTLLLSNADKRAAIANLTAELADLTRQRDNAWGAIDEYVEQRNALAAEVDDLRNVNAGLREDNAKMAAYTDALKKDNERMTFDLDQARQHAENRNKRVAVLAYENGNLKEENRHLRQIANQEAK